MRHWNPRKLSDGGHLNGMRNEGSRDPWLNQAHTPTTAWESALRPSRSSNRIVILVAAAAAALAASVAFNGWRDSAALRTQHEWQVAPTKPPEVGASPAPPYAEPELESARSPRVQRFAKCLTPTGEATYSDGPCPVGTQMGEVSVKPDANLADGVAQDTRQASMRHNGAIALSVYEHERRVAMNVDSFSSECAQLNALIASSDAAARQPQSGFEQDRLRDQRKRARDRQFALRCG